MSDLIDRQQAIEAICMETCGVSLKNERCMVHCTEVQTVEKLPPAQPERIKGHWVNGRCDKCNEHAPFWCMASTYYASNFCPNCGAEMEVTT